MIEWTELNRIQRKRAEYSDLHKDVFGMRPTQEHYIEVSQWSDEQLDAEFEKLVALLD